MSSNKVSCVSTLFPKGLVDALEGEKQMQAVTTLVCNIISRAAYAWKAGKLKEFDSNAGDAQCQNVAFTIWRLREFDFGEELEVLAEVAQKLKLMLTKRSKPKESPEVFFVKHVCSIEVSRRVDFVLHSYLLAKIRKPSEILANGIINTISDVSALGSLSKRINCVAGKWRKGIVNQSQSHLSALTAESVKGVSRRVYTPDEKYLPKTFVNQFSALKMVLLRLREAQVLVGIKSIVPKGRRYHILFWPKKPGGEFSLAPDEKRDPMTRIVIIEAVIKVSRMEAIQHLMDHGFTETILSCASELPPYQPGTKLKDVEDDKEKDEMVAYQKKNLGSFLTLDHVYVNTLKYEKIDGN